MKKSRKKLESWGKTIVLPEAEDERVLLAAEAIIKGGLTKVVLIGDEEKIKYDAKSVGANIEGAKIIDPKKFQKLNEYVAELVELRKKKGMTEQLARQILKTEPRYFGAMMVRLGDADGMVAGSASPTADVLRAAIQVIGTKPGLKTVSSCFIMVLDEKAKNYGDDGILIFSDCGVVPHPNSEQMADIATSAAYSARQIGLDPRVALLSFSTMGSASHECVDRVQEAVKILKNRSVDFKFDGELQADAALVPSVGEKKAPGSEVAGKANVLVFPNLSAGNIGYKLVQRLGNAEAYGPILQGLAKPVNDLSRGCSVEDIVNVAAITAVLGN